MSKKLDVNYERLGRDLITIAESTYKNKKRLYAFSFYKGVLTGIGSVIGATIGVAVILFILSLLGEIPFIGKIAESLSNTLESVQ